jgi:hypothetical protein
MPLELKVGTVAPGSLDRLRQGAVVAIDIGFGSGKSSGIASKAPGTNERPRVLSFAEAASSTLEFLLRHRSACLVLEAPLSCAFSANGDPVPRAPFERQVRKGKLKYRDWYFGPGAATTLAAVFFFRHLIEKATQLRARKVGRLVIYEGFLSFKERRSRHDADATQLLEAFLAAEPRALYEPRGTAEKHLLCVLDILFPEEKLRKAPPVVICR